MKPVVPSSLRIWFKIHFFVDILFAIPLIIAPSWILGLFGFSVITPVLARLVGAALVGIGVTSLFTTTKEQFDIMLTFKIIWSVGAIIGLLWSLEEGAPAALWTVVVMFVFFWGLWTYYKWKD